MKISLYNRTLPQTIHRRVGIQLVSSTSLSFRANQVIIVLRFFFVTLCLFLYNPVCHLSNIITLWTIISIPYVWRFVYVFSFSSSSFHNFNNIFRCCLVISSLHTTLVCSSVFNQHSFSSALPFPFLFPIVMFSVTLPLYSIHPLVVVNCFVFLSTFLPVLSLSHSLSFFVGLSLYFPSPISLSFLIPF